MPSLCGVQVQYLYGHQGRVAFSPEQPSTFIQAMRRLLGLGWRDVQYSLLEYKAGRTPETVAGEAPVRVYDDELPFRLDRPAWQAIVRHTSQHTSTGMAAQDHCCYFFVRPAEEKDPKAIRPTEATGPAYANQHGRNVAILARAIPNVDGIVDEAYLSFPRPPAMPDFHAAEWGSNHYNMYVREALRVLMPLAVSSTRAIAGIPLTLTSDATATQDAGPVLVMYDLAEINSAILTRMDPRKQPRMSRWMVNEHKLGREWDIANSLPGVYA